MTTTTMNIAIDPSTICQLRKGDKLTIVGPISNDKVIVRSVHIDTTNDNQPYVVIDKKDYVLGAMCFQDNAIVTAINGKEYQPPAPAPVTPPPAKADKGNNPTKAPKAPKAPKAHNAQTPLTTDQLSNALGFAPAHIDKPALDKERFDFAPAPAPVYTDTITDITRLIDVFSEQGNIEAVRHLTAVVTRLAVDSVASYNAQPVAPAPAPVYNPNKQDRASKQAPAPKKGNSYTVTMPLYDACNTTDPTLKNYVDPAVFGFVGLIEQTAKDIAAAAKCNIRVYYRGTWVWYQPVNTAKGYGRTPVFIEACNTNGITHSPRRGQGRQTIEEMQAIEEQA